MADKGKNVDKGHDVGIPQITVPSAPEPANEGVEGRVIPSVAIPSTQPTENASESDFTIPLTELKESPSIDDEPDTKIWMQQALISSIQPIDNEPGADLTITIAELKESPIIEDEQDVKIGMQQVAIPSVQPFDNEQTLGIKLPIVSAAPIQPIDNEPLEKYIIPLDGQWIPAADASQIGKNFTTLTNMRYADGHPEGMLGMTKINSTALTTYLKVREAFHFRKAQPAESHVMAQSYDTGIAASIVIQNVTAIPTAGDFVGGAAATQLWPATGSSGVTAGQFSYAPNGQMVYCNGVDTCIWGGNEMRVGAVITTDTALSAASDALVNPKDYTEALNNSKTDSANAMQVGGGNDTYTVLLLHGEGADASTTITDSSIGGGGAPPKTVTAAGNAQIDTSQAKFGSASILLDGTGDYVYVPSTDPDINDFFFSTGAFTIDFWVRFNALAGNQGFFGQIVDGDNWHYAYIQANGTIVYHVANSGTRHFFNVPTTITAGSWHHIAIIRGWGGSTTTSDGWAICVDGTNMLPKTYDNDNPTVAVPDLNANFMFGYDNSAYLDGWLDEVQVSKGAARWTSNFSPPDAPYSANSRTFLVGSTRPAQGIKAYVSSANVIASAMTVKEFNGSAWSALAVTDNTDTGASLAKTETITWASTVNTSKLKYIEGYLLYWYQFTLSAGQATLSHLTLDCPFQNISDLWDGALRQVASFYIFTTARSDNTVNVSQDQYDSLDAATYADVSSLTATTQYFELGFTAKQTGVFFNLPAAYVNTTPATAMSVDYWDGAAYVSVGTISDGTSEGVISLAKAGMVSWSNNDVANEQKRVIANDIPFHYYRFKFDHNLDASVRIYYVAGMQVSEQITGYSFSVHAADRLMLGCNNYEKKNELRISAQDAPDVFNGIDSFRLLFGNDTALTCGVGLFAQYASNIFNMVLIFKDRETWTLTWNNTTDGISWTRFQVTAAVGCPDPRTLKTVSSAFAQDIAQAKTIAIWRGHNGIYVSDGRTPLCVSKQIESVFDPYRTPHINTSVKTAGGIDYHKMEYHWLWASGSNTTFDKEYVLDLIRWRWYEIDRASGKYLQAFVDVIDTSGNNYLYGFLDTGYMERLEYGASFDGGTITCTMQAGDQILAANDPLTETEVLFANLVTIPHTTTTVYTLTDYVDGATSGTAYNNISIANSSHRIANVTTPMASLPGVFHGLKLVWASSTDAVKFIPLLFSIFFRKVRDHIRSV